MKARLPRSRPDCGSRTVVAAFLLVALALGIDNFAVAAGIGVSGVRGSVRAQVALVFGVFEAGMPVLGMVAGHAVSARVGGAADWVGGGILVAVGGYQIVAWYRSRGVVAAQPGTGGWGTWRLLASGLALSIDNLVVGFALGTYHVSLATAAVVIGLVSVAMSLAGLELGAKLGRVFGGAFSKRGALAGGIVLAVVGIAMAAGAF
jgi:manganese efflux pump family protein